MAGGSMGNRSLIARNFLRAGLRYRLRTEFAAYVEKRVNGHLKRHLEKFSVQCDAKSAQFERRVQILFRSVHVGEAQRIREVKWCGDTCNLGQFASSRFGISRGLSDL